MAAWAPSRRAREMRSATRPPLPRLDLFRRRGQPTNSSVGAIGAMWRRNAGNHGILGEASQCPKKPGPKGPSDALIQAIVELKSRNLRFR